MGTRAIHEFGENTEMAVSYQEHSLTGATGIELVIALYDGAVRFLYRAMDCVEAGDQRGRRLAIKRVVDILMYLQARLRPDVGGKPAAVLSDFYAAMFTLTLEASHAASGAQPGSQAEAKTRLQDVIACIRNVRSAWAVAAKDPEAQRVLPRELQTLEDRYASKLPARKRTEPQDGEAKPVSNWMA